MKSTALVIAMATALAAPTAWAADETQAIAHAMQTATVSVTAAGGPEIPGTNGIAGSFNGATNPINVLQNSGDAVVQNSQNVLARSAPCHCAGPALAEATGTQRAHVSVSDGSIARSGAAASNTIQGSFAGSSSMVNVSQNTGSNVVQNAQNTLAMVVRRP